MGLSQLQPRRPSYDNIGMMPPAAPIYPGFSKRIGIEELASFLENNSPSQENQRQPILQDQSQGALQDSNPLGQSYPGSQQQLVNSQFQQSSMSSGSGEKTSVKLPDDVPEDLKQQLMSAGILGNADIQVSLPASPL